MSIPILDPKPTGKPQDWSFKKIMLAKPPIPTVVRPSSWKNPNAHIVCKRDQAFRGTCVGQSTAYCYDLLYIKLTGDSPTPEDVSKYKKDVRDSLGTLHDILYPQSASAEGFYQVSRTIGNVTYPAGSETRYAARAWIQYGMNLEEQWHTDKEGKTVWVTEPRKTVDGGMSPDEAKVWAAAHRAEGWAMVGDEAGNANFDEICDAIYTKGFVLAGIPVYENYGEMQGGDGRFPEARGEIAGYHALCFYGYDEDTIYLLHSWGDWCSPYGSVSKNYINSHSQESVYLVVLDANDVKIGRDVYKSLTITVKDKATGKVLPADIYIDGKAIGLAPQKVAIEPGKTYTIEVKFMGYGSQKKLADGSSEEIIFELDADPLPQKTWWMKFIDWLIGIFRR